ncbi:MAG: TIGR00730 family Rossman fold protein [Breznakibacter sp.]|nr:TIGR00730 family Rossman fold protein [Breznakibacter sp.]
MKRVCVFCASSQQVPQYFFDDTISLAQHLVENGYGIQYGGGAMGLMGALADEVIRLNGKITGIIPHFMVEVEWEHKGVQEMVYVNTMAERKTLLAGNVDAVVALPGGTGTFEELFEVLSNKKLGIFTKPIILVNTNGFFNPFIELMNSMADHRFLRPEHLKMFTTVDSPSQVVQAIEESPSWGHATAKAMAALR